LNKRELLAQMAEASKRMGKRKALQVLIDCVDNLIKS